MISKKHFSLNPFWSSSDILNLSDENIILIVIKNATNLITFYELKELFDINFIEQVYLKNKNTFSKKTQELIETNLWIIKKEWKKGIKITFQKQKLKGNIKEELKIQKSLLLVERTKIRDFYDIAYMLEHNIITPEFILETIHKHKITYEDWFMIDYIRIKKQRKDDEGLKSLMDNPPTFNELKEYILEKLSEAVDLKYSQMMKKRKPGY